MADLYLCKMDPNVPGDAKFIAIIGSIKPVHEWNTGRDGYQFFPHTVGHKRSRKIWNTVNECIPGWANAVGFCQLLTPRELQSAQTKAARA